QRMLSEARSPGPVYTALADERNEMLDRLSDIPLKGFPEMEETPTSATMSLPTPESRHAPLPQLDPIQVPQPVPTVSYLFAEPAIVVPGAPRMKDYDTFTEGTAQGSFDSIPAADTNELGQPIYPISAVALAALPSNDAALFIEQWRQDVEDHLLALAQQVLEPAFVAANGAPAPDLPTMAIIDLPSAESEAGTTPTQKRPRPRSNSPEDG
ncbi:hypothetical protein R3P38DRAFT_2372185, partial [Favolaschia claudopus]